MSKQKITGFKVQRYNQGKWHVWSDHTLLTEARAEKIEYNSDPMMPRFRVRIVKILEEVVK